MRVRSRFPNPMRPNPYVVGPAVKDYSLIKGRYEETQKILSILRGSHQDNVPLVWGDRRIGKTTLLYRLSFDPEVRRHYEPVLCDFEGIVARNDLAGGLVKRFSKRIQRSLTGTPLGRVPLVFDDRADSLDQFQDYLDRLSTASGQKNLLLMMDEVELFFDHLRSEAEDAGDEKELAAQASSFGVCGTTCNTTRKCRSFWPAQSVCWRLPHRWVRGCFIYQ